MNSERQRGKCDMHYLSRTGPTSLNVDRSSGLLRDLLARWRCLLNNVHDVSVIYINVNVNNDEELTSQIAAGISEFNFRDM